MKNVSELERTIEEKYQKALSEIEDLQLASIQIEQLLVSISSILIRVDETGKVVYWNASAEKVLGTKSADIVGIKFKESEMPWDWVQVSEHLNAGERVHHQTRLDDIPFKRQDGSWGQLGISYTPLYDRDRQRTGYLLMGADITERKKMEQQLVQAQKLRSIGELATGIAHEINTPTQYVGDNIKFLSDSFNDLLRLLSTYEQLMEAVKQGKISAGLIESVEKAEKDADIDYLVEEIPMAFQQSQEGIQRVVEIIGAMKEFSHPGSDQKKATNINRAITSTLTMSRNEWKYVADLETDFEPDLPLVMCLEGELTQVFLNMIVNAAHSISDVIEDGGSTRGQIKISTLQHPNWVEIRITDTGKGIPEEIRGRIFDPFFTTKDVGKGTGQGLSIAYNVIVEKHGGKIDVESQLGEGTTFIIKLPIQAVSIDNREWDAAYRSFEKPG